MQTVLFLVLFAFNYNLHEIKYSIQKFIFPLLLTQWYKKVIYPTGKILPPTNSLTRELCGIVSLGIPST